MKYIISTFDPKTRQYSEVLVLPERRVHNPARITSTSKRRYIKAVMGEEWYKKNEYLLLIVTDYERGKYDIHVL